MPRDPDLADLVRSPPAAVREGAPEAQAPASPRLPFPVKDLRKWRIGIAVGAQAAAIILGIAAALLSSSHGERAEAPGRGSSLEAFSALVEEHFAAHLHEVIAGSAKPSMR